MQSQDLPTRRRRQGEKESINEFSPHKKGENKKRAETIRRFFSPLQSGRRDPGQPGSTMSAVSTRVCVGCA
eukprot:3275392-Rhodomonas_salina.1